MIKEKVSLALLQKIFAVTAALACLLAAIAVLRLDFIPMKYLLVLFAGSAVGIALLVRIAFRSQQTTRRRVVSIVLSVLLITLGLYIYSGASTVASFLSDVQADDSYETYSIVAEKKRDIKLASVKKAALLENDPYINEVKPALATVAPATQKTYANTTNVTMALGAQTVDAAVFNAGTMQLLSDNYPKFNELEVIATFRVKVEHKTSTNVDATKPFIVYISGIDTYGSVGNVSRSDVNMLAAVNPSSGEVLLVNTPRDYYVQLHGTTGTKDKLTHAGLYGINMSRQTLEDLYDTKIEYYVRINFSSLVDTVDAIGGIEVYSDYTFGQFHQGFNQLNGKQALAFSRERHAFEAGDRQRGKNQQYVIEAIIQKMSETKTLIKYQSILASLDSAIQTNMSSKLISGLANNQLDNLNRWSVESISVDGKGQTAPTYSMGAMPLYVMNPDMNSVRTAREAINEYQKERL